MWFHFSRRVVKINQEITEFHISGRETIGEISEGENYSPFGKAWVD